MLENIYKMLYIIKNKNNTKSKSKFNNLVSKYIKSKSKSKSKRTTENTNTNEDFINSSPITEQKKILEKIIIRQERRKIELQQ